jgi:predicted nuclease of predicted toxin-antitoxin system
MKLLIDMNLSTEWAELLDAAGHEAVLWSSIGHPAAGDEDLIRWAAENGAIVLTDDLGFGITLVTAGLDEPSVIQLRSKDLRPSTLGSAVLRALEVYAVELSRGALLTIDPARARVRVLELGNEW